MNEEKFSPGQSLYVIQSMIEKAKNQFSENGHLYLLWGWVAFSCSLAHFIPADYQLLLFSAAMVMAWIIPGYSLQKKYQQQKT